MIACYAWTDIQLVNQANLLMNQYAGERAHLFVLKLARVSPGALAALRKAGRFHAITEIEPWDAAAERGGGLDYLGRQRRRRAYYRRQFGQAAGRAVYSRAVTAGFWAETCFFLEAVRRNNEHLRIDLVEEGTRHGRDLFAYTLDRRRAARLLRYAYDGRYAAGFRRMVENAYFYAPERLGDGAPPGFSYRALRPVEAANGPVFDLLLNAVQDVDTAEYEKRRVILLQDAYACGLPRMIVRAAEAVGAERLAVKLHPAGGGAGARLPGVYYDDRAYVFEGLLLKLPLADKAVVLHQSAVAATIPYMLRKPCRVYRTDGLDPDFFRDLAAPGIDKGGNV